MPDDNQNDADARSALDEVVELVVYAPLGLALTVRDQLPALVERGRKQWAEQSTLARMMGQYAVKEARKDARRRFRSVSETLSNLSGPPAAPATAPKPATAAAPASAAPSTAETARSSNGKAPSAEPVAPSPSSAHLAIPGYDTLSASQVVQRLAGLAVEELDAVRSYEEATRGRRTILSKVAQLQSPTT